MGSIGVLCDECDYYGEKWNNTYAPNVYNECILCENYYSNF